MTHTVRHAPETMHGAHKTEETEPARTKIVEPSANKTPVEVDPIKEAAKPHEHHVDGQFVGSVDGKVDHGMKGKEIPNH